MGADPATMTCSRSIGCGEHLAASLIGPSSSSPRIARADADRPWVMTQSWHELLFVHWRTDPAFLRRVVERVFAPDETGAQSATSVHATWSIEGPRPLTAQS